MDEKIVIGEGTAFPLQGILSIPEGVLSKEDAVPAVILVQGSGSTNRDEAIYANRPFRDIADYLSAHGIAVIRYDKRSFTYGKQMVKELKGDLTVEQEMIEDALLAAKMLRSDPRIDSERVFLLGHSQGGMMAPRIDAEGGNFAGLIILAGSPRLLREILISQNEEAIDQFGWLLRTIARKQVAKLQPKLEAIPAMTEEEARSTKVFGSMYAWYFKDMEDHPTADYLRALTKPVLFIQGEKDAQVSVEKDFEVYKEICKGMPNVTFKLYPGLNHLFMPALYGTIKDLKKEYRVPAHVDEGVLSDICAWIQSDGKAL